MDPCYLTHDKIQKCGRIKRLLMLYEHVKMKYYPCAGTNMEYPGNSDIRIIIKWLQYMNSGYTEFRLCAIHIHIKLNMWLTASKGTIPVN